MKKRVAILLILIIGVFTLAGCNDEATIDTYSDPSFNRGSITRLAVFPMQNTRLAPSESRQINRSISQAINNVGPDIQIMSSEEATRILNDNNLTNKWAQFLSDYSSSGVPNTQTLFEIGDALNVDGILQGEIVEVFQTDGEYSYYGNSRMASSRVTVRYSILGTDSGKLLWEATSRGTKKGTAFDDAPPLIEPINLAQDKILENLPF